MNASFLQTYCSKMSSPYAPRRPIMNNPWRVEIKGQTWCVGTDGRGILGYRVNADIPPISVVPDSTLMADTVVQYLAAEMKGKTISLADLRKWCGKGTWEEKYTCDNCEGAGKFTCTATCKEGHHCENCCSFIACDGGEQPCTECVEGKKTRVPRIFGRIDGTLFDANLIACATDDVDEGPVDVSFGQHIPLGGGSPPPGSGGPRVLFLTGQNWRFIIMPMSGMSSIEERAGNLDCGDLVLA